MIIPAILLGLGYFLYPHFTSLSVEQSIVIKVLPVVLAAGLLLLCLRFNRSRLFFASLNILFLYFLLNWILPLLQSGQASLGYLMLCLLMPLNLLVFSELNERGVFTWWGGSRLVFMVLPLMIAWGWAEIDSDSLGMLLNYQFTTLVPLHWTTFTQSAQILMLVILLVMNGRLFAQPGAQRGALFGSLFALLAMLHFHEMLVVSSLMTMAALLMLMIALVQESWSMAYIDHLTGLPGRRALNEQLLKLSGNYSIAMLDIDHFKKFNDRYGHDAGDEVLSMVAARIKNVGSGGKVYRYGGEEFTIVFPGKVVKEVMGNLENIRDGVAGSPFHPARKERRKSAKGKRPGKPRGVTVSISIGIAERNERYPTPADVIKAADKALYRAKKKGRNRVCK